MHENKRIHERAPLAVEVTLDSENTFYAGVTADVSEGGVFVATYTPPPIGSLVYLDLEIPNRGKWPVAGVVRWVRDFKASVEGMPPGCGVQFVEIGADALKAIRAFVAEREPLLYEAA
jgi:uncharacterized protein (TIGR02266 family)